MEPNAKTSLGFFLTVPADDSAVTFVTLKANTSQEVDNKREEDKRHVVMTLRKVETVYYIII